MQLLVALTNGNHFFEVSPELKPLIVNKSKSDIEKSLAVLEEFIVSRTFFAGDRLTVVDISLYVTIATLFSMKLLEFGKFPSLFRWFMTVGSNPKIAAVSPLPKSLQDSSSSSSGALTPGGGGVIQESGTIVQGRWRRYRIRVKVCLKRFSLVFFAKLRARNFVTCVIPLN